MKRYQLGADTKHDLTAHLVWIPKDRKKVLTGEVATRVRDLLRQIATEHEIAILSGKVASDHIHVLVAYRPHVDLSVMVQWLKEISSRILLQEFVQLGKALWGRHLWAHGYLAVSTGNLTDEMVTAYIAEQEGKPVHDDSRFVIDYPTKLPPSRRELFTSLKRHHTPVFTSGNRQMKHTAHKRPRDSSPSEFVARYAKEIALNAEGPILDVPCGYGRNAACLASYGVPVICIDNNDEALEAITSSARLTNAVLPPHGLLTAVKLDLIRDPWPFEEDSIGAIINVHYCSRLLVQHFVHSLKVGGHLLIETISGHGNNYLELPPQGFVRTALANAFEIRYLKERAAGPPVSDASSFKLFAIKKRRT